MGPGAIEPDQGESDSRTGGTHRPDSPATCPECGAAVPEGGTCRDLFHALLLEGEVAGGPVRLPHFSAVASYGLQPPGSTNGAARIAAGLRASVAGLLDGRVTLAGVRRRTGEELDGPPRDA